MGFYIRMEGKYALNKTLFYEEGSHLLQLDLQFLAVKPGGWIVIDKQFLKWTVPEGEPIFDEKRSEIMQRIGEWANRNNTKIVVTRALTREEIEICNKGGKLPNEQELLGCDINDAINRK